MLSAMQIWKKVTFKPVQLSYPAIHIAIPVSRERDPFEADEAGLGLFFEGYLSARERVGERLNPGDISISK